MLFIGNGHLLPGKLRLRTAQLVTLVCIPLFGFTFFLDGLSIGKRIDKHRLNNVKESFEIMNWKAIDFYRLMVFLVFDSITPKYQFRHRQKEVFLWFKENGFGDVQTHDVIPGYYWGNRCA